MDRTNMVFVVNEAFGDYRRHERITDPDAMQKAIDDGFASHCTAYMADDPELDHIVPPDEPEAEPAENKGAQRKVKARR